VELQFYPDSIVSKCFNDGGFSVNFSANTYTACSPVFKVVPNNTSSRGFTESAAFNAMLEDSATPGSPLVMNAGDTITVHYFVTPAFICGGKFSLSITCGRRNHWLWPYSERRRRDAKVAQCEGER